MYLTTNMSLLLLMFLIISKSYVASQLTDPCAGIFRYVADDNRNYHGEITIKYPPKYESSCLEVTLFFFEHRTRTYESGLSLGSKQPVTINGEASFVYRIYYDNYYPTIPFIKEIKFNNIVMCQIDYKIPELTRIMMHHCLYPPKVNFTFRTNSDAENHEIRRLYFNEVIDVSRTYVVPSENPKPTLEVKKPDDGLADITLNLKTPSS